MPRNSFTSRVVQDFLNDTDSATDTEDTDGSSSGRDDVDEFACSTPNFAARRQRGVRRSMSLDGDASSSSALGGDGDGRSASASPGFVKPLLLRSNSHSPTRTTGPLITPRTQRRLSDAEQVRNTIMARALGHVATPMPRSRSQQNVIRFAGRIVSSSSSDSSDTDDDSSDDGLDLNRWRGREKGGRQERSSPSNQSSDTDHAQLGDAHGDSPPRKFERLPSSGSVSSASFARSSRTSGNRIARRAAFDAGSQSTHSGASSSTEADKSQRHSTGSTSSVSHLDVPAVIAEAVTGDAADSCRENIAATRASGARPRLCISTDKDDSGGRDANNLSSPLSGLRSSFALDGSTDEDVDGACEPVTPGTPEQEKRVTREVNFRRVIGQDAAPSAPGGDRD